MNCAVEGYTTKNLCELAGVTYRQADYWARNGVLVPTLVPAVGQGSQRLYNATDVVIAYMLGQLSAQRCSRPALTAVVNVLRRDPEAWDAVLLVTEPGGVIVTTTPAAALAELGLVACWLVNPAAALARARQAAEVTA
ncbi:MAG: hypothetical protein SHS37scaffold145_78 [Phage 71_18]|nr:MAG: hypothetical protein SHS37scaffold145_78 [Phage 71_18]